jgi:hypothetical protein
MRRPTRRNLYTHSIEVVPLRIKNCPPDEFRKQLERIEYRGYEVETLKDGRKIVITKPGGKFVFGQVKREDFMVWIYNPRDATLWLISHKDIYTDLKGKAEADPEAAVAIIDALERVYKGEEPEDILNEVELKNPSGEPPEVLLKAYKWIWGQEDCNYPDGLGRRMSWEGLRKEGGRVVRTGTGIADLREHLRRR